MSCEHGGGCPDCTPQFPPNKRLEAAAYAFAFKRTEFSRERFQRVIRCGFATRDRLLLMLMDDGVIEYAGPNRFRVLRRHGGAA